MSDKEFLPEPALKDDEITLKELILKFREYFEECKKHWKLIFLFSIPFIAYQLYERFTKPATYGASLTFMVNDSQGSSIGGVLGQLTGLTGEDEDKLDKILALANSRRTIGNALFHTAEINGKPDYLANHLIREQGLHDKWRKDTMLSAFLFNSGNVDSFSLVENRAFYALHKVLIGTDVVDPIFTTSSNKKTGIMSFSLRTHSEELTLKLIKTIFNSLSDFYIESTVRKEKESYEILVAKKDSIERVLFRNDISSALHDDRNNSLLLQVDKVPAKRFSRNNNILTTIYAEVLKNTELAEFALKTATPFITSIDEPIPPIKPLSKGRIKDILIYCLSGMFLGVLFVIARKIYRTAMAEQ
jgi:uncharacterized protein involved in exopolysaccharide biosynthesis